MQQIKSILIGWGKPMFLIKFFGWPVSRVGPNSEYGPNTKYRIIRFLKMNEYRIALFGLNYSNIKYLKKFYMWILWPNEMRKIWSFIFIPTWGLFTVFSIQKILLLKNSKTIWYLVTTIRVFKYYLEIKNGLNTEYT